MPAELGIVPQFLNAKVPVFREGISAIRACRLYTRPVLRLVKLRTASSEGSDP
jgi:hypothetical protein